MLSYFRESFFSRTVIAPLKSLSVNKLPSVVLETLKLMRLPPT